MQCVYCAEQIQDEAIVCRFCGARKVDDAWVGPEPGRKRSRSSFLFRSSGLLFILSALFELFSLTDATPLFGALRGGVVAVLYHGLFVAAFLAIGIGLWRAAHWGYHAVLFGTALYTVDKLLYLFDDDARQAVLSTQFARHPELEQMIDPASLENPLKLMTVATLLGFWLFALLVHRRRAEFH